MCVEIAFGVMHSDWPPRMLASDVSARIDRWPAFEEPSIASMQAQAATFTKLLRLITVKSVNKTGFGSVIRQFFYCLKESDVSCVNVG